MWKPLSITIVCKQPSKYDAQNLQCTAQNVLRQKRVFSAGLKHTKTNQLPPRCHNTSEQLQPVVFQNQWRSEKKKKGSGYRPSSRWSNQRQRRSGGTLVNIGWFTFLFCCFLFVFLCQRSAWSFSSRSARGTQAYYGKPVEVHTWVNKIETEALAVAVNASLLTELMNCCQVELKTASTADVDRDAFPSHHVKAKSQQHDKQEKLSVNLKGFHSITIRHCTCWQRWQLAALA